MNARTLVTPLAIIAALLVFWLVNPWFTPADISETVQQIVTVAFWILAIVVIVLLFEDRKNPDAQVVEVDGPAFARYLFSNTRAGLLWLPIRLFVGFAWLESGWGKFTSPAWTDGGEALRGYWERAAAIPEEGRPPITYDWYREFIQLLLDNGAESWFAWVVMIGEMAIGIGLILGILTGFAAFFGALMNMSFLLAGSASTNPVMFTFAIGLILAWRVAGYYGLDRYILPVLGTPWRAKVQTGSTPPTGAPAPG
jgi:thiosulfate dehydrogenase [quinone] large subunit